MVSSQEEGETVDVYFQAMRTYGLSAPLLVVFDGASGATMTIKSRFLAPTSAAEPNRCQ